MTDAFESPATSSQAAPLGPPEPPPEKRRYDRSIVEGPLRSAVWKIAWPTMLTNIIGGLQGIVDHALVGHLVGFKANAAIGVAWQIFIVVIVFITSLFTGMSVLVARFAGAGEEDKVNRTVYQAFLTAVGISLLIMAPLGYALSPSLLDLVNAAPEVKARGAAVPPHRVSLQQRHAGVLHARRRAAFGRRRAHADDPRHRHDGAESRAERHPDPRAGPDPGVRHCRFGDGNDDRFRARRAVRDRGSCGAAAGSCRSRADKATLRIGTSSGRFSDLACRPAFRESR